MKYSYEFKRKCVALHRQGKWAKTPEGIKEVSFHSPIREWMGIADAKGRKP